ncbi:MAG: hypothetical protein HYZ83_04400, partial [Candidatus Omnitrophica bacterium]|nr:hypothetical protein [Candidatus Omnitrophota bacterium]
MKKEIHKKLTALLTVLFLGLNQLVITPQASANPFSLETKLPSADFKLDLPPELGTIQALISGPGPVLIQIQTAHGNYEAQKKIQAILHHLKKQYGIDLLLLEGSASKLNPELLDFFGGRKNLNMKMAEALTRQALVKGDELFLIEEPKTQAYGIENIPAYRRNREAFKAVLTQREKTEKFVEGMNMQIKRLTAPYLSRDLKTFLNRAEDFEGNQISGLSHFIYLKEMAKKNLELDLTDPANQIDWPMLLRLYKLAELESRIDLRAFEKERAAFLRKIRWISPDVFAEIQKLLSSPLSKHRLPDPGTGILFEKMVAALPADFDYQPYPNVQRFMGHLILQSEIKEDRLAEETEQLTDKIAQKLAKTKEEKNILSLFNDYKLLKKLFALELTPKDYETILERRKDLAAGKIIKRFLDLNHDRRVKNVQFVHVGDINILFKKAMRFYRGTKERDRWMLQNILDRLKGNKARKAVVITGGFHAGPFKNFFQKQGFNYALIAPKITSAEGREAYLQAALQDSELPLKKSTMELSRRSETRAIQAALGENLDWIDGRIDLARSEILRQAGKTFQRESLRGPALRSETRAETPSLAVSGNFPLNFKNALSGTVTPEHGITPEGLTALVPELVKAHRQIQEWRQGEKSPLNRLNYEFGDSYYQEMRALGILWKDESDDIVILGGTASGAEMAFRALVHEKWNDLPKEKRNGYPRIHFVSPDKAGKFLNGLNLQKTRIVIIGDDLDQDPYLKLGYQTVKQKLAEALGAENVLKRIAIVTDLVTPDVLSADAANAVQKFRIPFDLSLKNSFFTAAGLLPLMLAGKDNEVAMLRKGAREAQKTIDSLNAKISSSQSFVLEYSDYLRPALVYFLYTQKHKNIAIFHVFSEKLRQFGTWRANRLNDLMGRTRQTLIFRGSVGTRHNHAELQDWQKGANHFQVTTLGIEEFSHSTPAGPTSWPLFQGVPLGDLLNASRLGTEEGLAHGKRPNMNISIPRVDAENLGRLIYSAFYEDAVLRGLLVGELEKRDPVRSEARQNGILKDDTGIDFTYSLPRALTEFEQANFDDDLETIMLEVAGERLSNKHDFLNLPEHMIERIQTSDFRDPISRLKKDKSKFIIIGIGGSSQGAKMEFENLGISTENLIFLEGIDPDYTEELLEGIDLTEAGVMVISKSGETLESNVILSLVRQKMVEAFRQKGKTWNPQDSIVAVTDPAVGILRKEATRFGYGLLEVPPLVDGRFSVLSDVGIAVMSLVMEEGQILEFLKGAQDYVERTELSLSLLKDLEEEKDREETRPKDDRRLEHLNREVRTELKRKSAAAIGYQYGGWSSFWTIAEKKGLWLDIALSGDFGEMIEEMIQLWNESIGKPAVDEEGHSILYYRRGVVAPQELRLNSSLLNHPDQAITLWNLKRDDDPAQDHLQQAIRADIQNKLKFSPTPIFGYDIPRNLRALGALTVMKQQSVVVHSKTKLLGKPMEYSGQPGVEDSKRRARKSIQDKKGVSIDVIPQELAPLGDFVRSVGLLVSTELANVNFEDPQARENAVALLIRKAIEENQGPAAIKSVWMRDQEKPEMINDKGTKTMAVVPLDKSSVVDMSNGTIGSLFAVYKGDELTPENLEATFILLYGPTTVMIARVVPDGEAQVYDFIWSEEHHEFVQKQHAGRETSLIELTKKGDEIAFNGRLQDWPDYLEKFYYAEIKRRGKKVRISETVADLYEMLLKGGLVAVALTDVEAVMWGSVMEGAGGRSLVMTPEGPQSAMTLKLGAESFQTDKKHWAFFGNKEVMDRLEAAMKESRDNPEYKPPVWHGQIREQNDNKLLTEALAEMGEDSEIINIMQASAATAIEVVRPMFSKIGIEEGGGSVNSAGDEQVGADQATNTAFRNGLFNPKRDPALELELVNAEASNLKVPSDKLPDALISAFFSEEEARGYGGNPNAKYSVIFDPLDGSSKVDTNGGVSTIGGIWKSKRATPPSADLPKSDDPVFVNYLQGRTGREGLHGSFFFLYGPQTLLYYTSEKTKKVHVFRLDPLKKEFRRIGVLGEAPKGPPKVGLRLAIGGERPDMVPEGLSDSLTTFEKKHNGRAAYAGSLNADGVGIFNGNDPLADGGGYIYPGTKRRPEGRLRLDSEEAPLALIMEKIGGRASNGRQNILDIPIQKLHQHEPLFIGTEWFVDQIDAIHARSETRTKKQVEAIDVVDLETRGKALIDFLKTHLSGRNNNAHPFTFEDLQKLREWYASPTVPEEERAAFNHHITSILFGGRSLIVPASNEASAEGHKIHVIGGPSLLDLDIRFEDEGEGNPLRLVYAQARRGGAAKLTAPFGVESRFFGLTGAKSTLESRLLRELSARGVKGQGKTIHIPGVSRTNIFFSDKDGKHTIDLKLRPPVLDRETAARLLKEIDENFPP